MAINQGETLSRFLQKYESYSYTDWYTAYLGPSNHKAIKTMAKATWMGTSNLNTAVID